MIILYPGWCLVLCIISIVLLWYSLYNENRILTFLLISNGKTINQAKYNSTQSIESNSIDKLAKEKNRLEKTINQLQQRLEVVIEQLSVA